MGADFLIAYFPRFKMTEDRKAAFCRLLADPHQCPIDEDELEQEINPGIDAFLLAIEYSATTTSRDSTTGYWYDRDGRQYAVTITGGLSHGDSPTDSFDEIELACRYCAVYELAKSFSIQDCAAETARV